MEKQGLGLTVFSSTQWFFFIFANTLVVPISIAAGFGLSDEILKMMLRSSLIFTGLACVFQGWLGHRFPIMEGHSGLLWGVILNLALSGSRLGLSPTIIGGGIATGIILACLVIILIGAFNGIAFLQAIFSPMVMSVYLFLLSFQLIFIFFEGMFPLTSSGAVDIPQSLFSIAIVVFVSVLKLKGTSSVSNFSILLGMVIGWLGYAWLFPGDNPSIGNSASILAFELFPLGKPNLEIGIVVVTFFAVLLNISNTIVSLRAVGGIVNQTPSSGRHRGSLLITSVFTAIGACFGLVPFTPFASSIGFLESTRIFQRKPFLIGGGLIAIIGIIPIFGSLLATMPISVGNAVLFVAYLQLFGTAYNSLSGRLFNSNTIFRLAIPVLIGLSLMNMPTQAFLSLPLFLRPFISNGLVVGVLLSIFLEKTISWEKYELFKEKNN